VQANKQGKIRAGYNNLRRKKKKQQCKVGREEEGSSSNQPEREITLFIGKPKGRSKMISNRPEVAALLLALRDTLIEELLLYLCDN